MNRVAIGALCVAACVLSVVERRALGAFALEQMEHMFDVVESVFHLA